MCFITLMMTFNLLHSPASSHLIGVGVVQIFPNDVNIALEEN